jgi:hypothetical protein
MNAQMTWLSEDEIDAVVAEALGVLQHVGMRMTGSKARPRRHG